MNTRALSSLGASTSGQGLHLVCRTSTRADAAFRETAATSSHHKAAPDTAICTRRGIIHVGAFALGNLWLSGAYASADQSDRKSLEVRGKECLAMHHMLMMRSF